MDEVREVEMLRISVVLIGVLTLLSPMLASAENGWEALGRMLSGDKSRQERVYRDQYLRNMEVQSQMRQAAAAERMAQMQAEGQAMSQAEQEAKALLAAFWMQVGLDPTEATAVAGAYELNAAQAAHDARAMNEGFQAAMDAAIEAYHARQYLLANQLLVASYRAHMAGD